LLTARWLARCCRTLWISPLRICPIWTCLWALSMDASHDHSVTFCVFGSTIRTETTLKRSMPRQFSRSATQRSQCPSRLLRRHCCRLPPKPPILQST
ncbi:hypothetical protein GGH91_005692, partial [Coemansia sp. RSA 2671]